MAAPVVLFQYYNKCFVALYLDHLNHVIHALYKIYLANSTAHDMAFA